MNIFSLELLFTFLVLFCVGAYYIGKKKNIVLLKSLGQRGFFVSLALLIFETLVMIKRGMVFD
ncbi:MAG: hypothetical protein PHF67_02375 [Candidatus Nanoarchaeia archaeon]|nr:hypothetical protein [Candidatus Nanoarchaeia archaeon]